MKIFVVSLIIFYLSIKLTQCSLEEVDNPLDMLNYDRSTKSMKKPKTVLNTEPIQNDRCTVFLSRFINILLKNTGISSGDNNNEVLKSYTSVTINVQDLQLLKNMVNNKDIDYLEIDRILNGMFVPAQENISESKLTYKHSYLQLNQIKEVLYWLSLGSILIGLLYIIFRNIYRISSVTFILFIIFILAFASTWYTMYTKAVINRSVHLEKEPTICQQTKNSWLTFPWYRNDLEECKRYKEAIHLDPLYSIAVTEVFAEMISKMMVKPIETLGDSIYVFNKSVLKDFPLWGQLILIPIIIIIVIKMLLLSCALFLGRHLSMKSIFGFGDTSIDSMPINNRKFKKKITKNNISNPITSTQDSESSKVNLHFNFFNPNSPINRMIYPEDCFSFNNKLNIKNKRKEDNLTSMLKNEDIDSVDFILSKDLIRKKSRQRTLSF